MFFESFEVGLDFHILIGLSLIFVEIFLIDFGKINPYWYHLSFKHIDLALENDEKCISRVTFYDNVLARFVLFDIYRHSQVLVCIHIIF